MMKRTGHTSTLEAVTLGLIATGAVSIAVTALVGAIRAGGEIFGSPVPVPLPLRDAQMGSLEGVAGVASAEYTRSVVSLDSLGAGTRWLLLAEAALPALATITVCMTLWWLGLSLIRQRTFRRSMAPVLGIAAVALVVAGLIGPLLGAIARTQVVEQLGTPDTFWSFLFEADLGPVGWGIALSLVASAFEVGQRLQKDSEGLV